MQRLLDILASGIHDAKNQLFQAEACLAEAETRQGIDLADARYAIEAAARRLNRTLTAYRLGRHEQPLAVVPTVLADLLDEVVLIQRPYLTHKGLTLDVRCDVADEWPLDRDLLTDILNNAIYNASRYARQQISLSATRHDDGLLLTIADDGFGFESIPPATGTGLRLAQQLAQLHARRGRQGSLTLDNASPLGGARVMLWLP